MSDTAALPPLRRVVTGLDADGKSCVLIDGPPRAAAMGGGGLIWRTEAIPADNSPQQDCPGDEVTFELMHTPGSLFMVGDFAPGRRTIMHATDTIDYIVMMAGEVVLELETGETVLRAGDVSVDRGVVHAWRNDTDQTARIAFIIVPAKPVGAGRTV